MILNEAGNKVEPAEIPDDLFARAFDDGMRAAARYAKRRPELADTFHDAAVDALLWARQNCNDATTFVQFASKSVKTFLYRAASKASAKANRRPEMVEINPELAAAKPQTSPGLKLIEDLPHDLAWIVSLYMDQAFTLREIGLLTGKSPNTIDLMLKRAATILAEGRLTKPVRRHNEKRLSAGG